MLLKSSRLAVVAAFLATASMVAPNAAQAGWRGYYGYHKPYYGGYYPHHYGYHRPYYVYKKRRSNSGAIAAALIGGIALGAILAASTQRSYARSCIAHRQAYTRSGRPFIKRVRVC